MKRLRVLISSHQFSPDQGSECAVGWNIVTRMASLHDVTVLCADGAALYPNSYRDAVERYFAAHGPIPGLKVVYVKQPPITERCARINQKLMALTKGVGWQPLFYVGLDEWHREAFRVATALDFANFDIVHQLTPISFLRPGYFWKSGLPFFWGPLGGMYKVPSAFAQWGGFKTRLFENVRNATIEWRFRTSTGFRRAVRSAVCIWTITDDERRMVDRLAPGKPIPMIETASPAGIKGIIRRYDHMRPLRLIWSGEHTARKAMPLLLQAIALLESRHVVSLDVLGEGPETANWQKLAEKLHLRGITWHGKLPYQDALQTMGEADVFVHSSIREGTPHVVLEALSWGLPVICHDACGMGVVVDDTCGIKVPFISPEKSIEGFRDALERIICSPEFVERLSAGALRRSSVLNWDAKVKEIAEAYSQTGI
jgi:glycosyltransferase involved in cell wall biosynthesis